VTLPQFVRFTVRIPWPVRSMNRLASHWAPRGQSTKVRRTVAWLETRRQLMSVRGLALDPRAPKRITFEAHGPRRMDPDNLILKPYIDGLRDAGVIHDDGPREVTGHDIQPATQVIDRAWRGLVITVELLPGGTTP
jgi:hypothetical protein